METTMADKEQCSEVWKTVIKVNYGGTLKRFSACVYGQKKAIEYDMDKLKAKISAFFNFSPNEVLVFTYTDKDGDVVSLDDDEELYDAVLSQKLNPLRINVQLKSYSADGSDSEQNTGTKSEYISGSKTDKKSPQTAAELKVYLEESLKSIPEPIHSALAVLSPEALQVVLASPNFSDFLVLLSKGSKSEASTVRKEKTDLLKPSSSKKPENSHLKQCFGSTSYDSLHFDQNTINEELKGREFHRRNGIYFADPPSPPMSFGLIGGRSNPNFAPMLKQNKLGPQNFNVDFTAQNPFNPMLSFPAQKASTSHSNGLESKHPSFPFHSPTLYPYKNPASFHGEFPRSFHQGIICSGCGMSPIIGSRYKSSVEEDFDLCSTCIQGVCGRTDFTKIDWFEYNLPKETLEHSNNNSSQIFSNLYPRMKVVASPKLDSCFVRDLSVWDGTVVGPSSPFTKIWRMKNNGTISWPVGTRLVRVRGDSLKGRDSIELEIPERGIRVDEELDIAIDLIAPAVPGRYRSYWQMVSPLGKMFGEEIWVIIQVDDTHSDSSYGTYSLFNSTFPPQTGIQINEPMADFDSDEPTECLTDEQKANRLVDELLKPDSPDLLYLNSLKSTSFLQSLNDKLASSISCAINGSLFDIPFPPNSASSSSLILNSAQQDDSLPLTYRSPPYASAAGVDNLAEKTLQRELEEIGFVQIDQNKQSAKDLCAFTESDVLLEDLRELGFIDGELNPDGASSELPSISNRWTNDFNIAVIRQ